MLHKKEPTFRMLKAYAFDPSASQTMDTAEINRLVYKIKWEKLDPGPCGEYVEVIDYDPTIGKYYEPVDLNDKFILAQNGLDPSESNPQFHQQMVYAVAMTTIKNFEKALGRKVLWSPRLLKEKDKYEEYVPKLRIYPHALRQANAYYSPFKKALLFGYFSATPANAGLQMPDSLVFTCLSHDIITHEVTHAILDGMYTYYNESSNPDVLAFHEAFADIVALFQHFTYPIVLKHQIRKTRGNLANQNLLGQLAQQFGSAIGSYGSLRDAIGEVDEKTGEWKPKVPNPSDYKSTYEPHKRGSILVAAIFEAFINIYKDRVADLLRIATNGTGILPQGELHPDLVDRLASEASKAARHVLNMCIRALDYCPPVDITFGDYLRAIITADADLVLDDPRHYRLAFIESFRRRGIYPEGIKTLSIDSLRYKSEPALRRDTIDILNIIGDFLSEFRDKINYVKDRETIFKTARDYIGGAPDIKGLHKRIFFKFEDSIEFEKLTGIVFNENWKHYGVRSSYAYGDEQEGPSFGVQDLRLVSRTGPDGNQINQIVFSLLQRSGAIVKDGEFVRSFVVDDSQPIPEDGMVFRGGCTLIFDMDADTLCLRYSIAKPILDIERLSFHERKINEQRVRAQHQYQFEEGLMAMNEFSQHFHSGFNTVSEPFAFLHKH